jgi:hypothetical protein
MLEILEVFDVIILISIERPFLFDFSLCYILLECLKTKEKESIYLIRKEKAQ